MSYSDGTNSLVTSGDKIRIDAPSGAGDFAQPDRTPTDTFATSDIWISALLEMPSNGFLNFRMIGNNGDFWIRAQSNGSLDFFE